MRAAFVREITRQRCFQKKFTPWILRFYAYPYHRWHSRWRQGAFGAPSFLLFSLYQRFWPFPLEGTFTYNRGGEKLIRFNAKNSQFQAIYFDKFAEGYEPQTTSLINAITPPDGVFYDVGSNWGWFSFSLVAQPGFRGKVHAFEPFPETYADLRSVVKQAGLEERIHCHAIALSDHAGAGTMHMPDGFSSGLALLDEGQVAGRPAVQVQTLDSLALDPPHVMKVDVEGGELKVFTGGMKMISQHKPMIIFENCRPFDDSAPALNPIYFLSERGYVFYRLAWRKTLGQKNYFVGDELKEPVQSTEFLTLVEFDPSERLMLVEDGNLFACHRDKLEELSKYFQPL